MNDGIDFADLRAIGYKREELNRPYFAMVNPVRKEAFIYDHRLGAIQRFERGIQGRVWLDHTGAWNAEYATGKDEKDEATYLPINEVLPLIGYKVMNF